MVGGPFPEPGHREQRPQRRFHDPSCRGGGRVRNRDRWDESAAGGALGRTQWSLASPATFTNDALLTRVDTPADGSAWAGGFQRGADGTRGTLIEHASGGTWTPVASPNDGTSATDNSLIAIGGTQATGLCAVGWRESPSGLQPLVLRYDTTRPSPAWVSVSGAGG